MTQQTTQQKLYFVQALTNVHCGTGQGVGEVDLPTAREAATGFPLIPGSTVKGVMRDYFRNNTSRWKTGIAAAFGPDFADADPEAAPHAAALMITDARILLLPTRSFAGVFAYVSCPMALRRFATDLRQAGFANPASVPEPGLEEALVSSKTNLVDGMLLLEDLELKSDVDNVDWKIWEKALRCWAFEPEWGRDVAAPRMALVADELFGFLCDTALPVTARIKLDPNTGTVQKGALWYEESIPAESVLAGMIAANDSFTAPRHRAADILADFADASLTLQIGGKATTGKGICAMRFVGKGGDSNAKT